MENFFFVRTASPVSLLTKFEFCALRILFTIVLFLPSDLFAQDEIFIVTKTAGDRLTVSIKDTGQGINADVINHIFEPFFTTR